MLIPPSGTFFFWKSAIRIVFLSTFAFLKFTEVLTKKRGIIYDHRPG